MREHNVNSRGITPGSHEIIWCLLLQEPHFITRIGTQPKNAAMTTAVSILVDGIYSGELCWVSPQRWNIKQPFFAAQHLCSWQNIFFASTTPGSTRWTVFDTFCCESVTLEHDQTPHSNAETRYIDLSNVWWPMQVRHSLDVPSAHHISSWKKCLFSCPWI